eukprot:4767629-Amphidinium_carterae.1
MYTLLPRGSARTTAPQAAKRQTNELSGTFEARQLYKQGCEQKERSDCELIFLSSVANDGREPKQKRGKRKKKERNKGRNKEDTRKTQGRKEKTYTKQSRSKECVVSVSGPM